MADRDHQDGPPGESSSFAERGNDTDASGQHEELHGHEAGHNSHEEKSHFNQQESLTHSDSPKWVFR
jgi:hypothetical protein